MTARQNRERPRSDERPGVTASTAFPPLVEPGPQLSAEQAVRYSRHLTLPDVGEAGQRRLRAASVLVIGAGGLGAPVLHYLGAAGIGQITVIDDDVVETTNLQRQVLHRTEDIGRPKVDSARDALLRLDPDLDVRAIHGRLTPQNALDLFERHDIVLDGADNFATRYLSNDAAELTGTPLVWGTIFRFQGQASVFWPGRGPMLRDLFPDIPDADSVPSCAEGGVLGVLCGTVGSAMATEAVKLICGIGRPLTGRLLQYDALDAEYSTLAFAEDPDRAVVTDLTEVAEVCRADAAGTGSSADAGSSGGIGSSGDTGSPAGPAATRNIPGADPITVEQLVQGTEEHPHRVVVDVREGWERLIADIPGSVHVPLGEIDARGWQALAERNVTATDADLVLFCKAGVRSDRAARILSDEPPGRVRVRSLVGGIEEWMQQTTGTGAGY